VGTAAGTVDTAATVDTDGTLKWSKLYKDNHNEKCVV
jgi:hypothetical protein